MTIRVLVADDQSMVRAGFRMLLSNQDDIDVVAEASNGLEAVEKADRFRPDVILMDIRMPELDGLEATRRILATGGGARILVLTTFDDAELLLEAARRGAQGFVSKDIALEELLAAIRAVAAGANWFQPALTSSLRQAFDHRRNGAVSRLCENLTEREIEVLRLMAGGMTNKKIATTLRTAEGTVKNQVSSILSKLGVSDRVMAVLNAIEFGLI